MVETIGLDGKPIEMGWCKPVCNRLCVPARGSNPPVLIQRRIAQVDAEIDRLVYEQYGLPEEIAVVDGFNATEGVPRTNNRMPAGAFGYSFWPKAIR